MSTNADGKDAAATAAEVPVDSSVPDADPVFAGKSQLAPKQTTTIETTPAPEPADNAAATTTTTTTTTTTASSPPSRLALRISAGIMRSLLSLGMALHNLASPRPPSPDFKRTIPSTLHKGGDGGGDGGSTIGLQFYTPAGYNDTPTEDSTTTTSKTYPVVVNFHGGGFVLGAATDDARFARHVVETAGAVFVSVDYRLAPEYPFPTAVEDCADALLYLIRHAAELRLDPLRMATSGFSAGGNLCLSSLLRLGDYKKELQDEQSLPPYKFVATAAWYPVLDFKRTRAERRASSVRPELSLPPFLTSLFDYSYLVPVDLDLLHPYVSPYQASDDQLVRDLPQHIFVYTCEWDMLCEEGNDLARRLQDPPISKDVHHKQITGVAHAWDKSPSPFKPAAQAQELYEECCQKLKEIFAQ